MPGRLKVKVHGAKNLPVMDRANETTDAFVEMYFGDTTFKTDVCLKSLNPKWEHDWFVFEAEDQELQDHFLMLRVMDHDTYSANDPIGRVYIDINNLIDLAYCNAMNTELSSTRPEAISRKRQSTASRDSTSSLSDDASSAYSEGAITLNTQTNVATMSTMRSAEIRGAMPIVDTLLGQRGMLNVTVVLELLPDTNILRESSCGVMFYIAHEPCAPFRVAEIHGFVDAVHVLGDPEYAWIDKIRAPRATNEARLEAVRHAGCEVRRKLGKRVQSLGANAVLSYRIHYEFEHEITGQIVIRATGTAVTLDNGETRMQRRSVCAGSVSPVAAHQNSRTRSVSTEVEMSIDELATSRGSNVIASSTHRSCTGTRYIPAMRQISAFEPSHSSSAHQTALLPLLTTNNLPAGIVAATAGVVCARAVRLLREDEKESNDVRTSWWADLRTEIISHMKSLACNAVIGYREHICIADEVIIASAEGTAALLRTDTEMTGSDVQQLAAAMDDVHSAGMPPNVDLWSEARPVQTVVVRRLDNNSGDDDQATEISNLLPFVEHQMHNSLMETLANDEKARYNAVLDMHSTYAIHDNALVVTIRGLAVNLNALHMHDSPNRHFEQSPTKSEIECPDIAVVPLNRAPRYDSGVSQQRKIDRSPAKKPVRNTSFERNDRATMSPVSPEATDARVTLTQSSIMTRKPSWSLGTSVVDAVRRVVSRPDIDLSSLYQRENAATPPISMASCRDTITLHVFRTSVMAAATTHSGASTDKLTEIKRRAPKSIGRLMNRFKRRQVDREDFATAIFLRNLCMQIGFVDESWHPNETHTSNLQSSSPRYGCVITRCRQQRDYDRYSVIFTTQHMPNGRKVGLFDGVFIRQCTNVKSIHDVDIGLQALFRDACLSARAQAASLGASCLSSARFSSCFIDGSMNKHAAYIIIGLQADIITL